MSGAKGSRKFPHSGIDEEIRHQLATLARRSRARTTKFSRRRSTEWRPFEVRNPNGLIAPYFTDGDAWDLIASRLEHGHHVEVIELRQPPSATGYVMMINLGADEPSVYVKLELGSGQIFGRSFHYSEHP